MYPRDGRARDTGILQKKKFLPYKLSINKGEYHVIRDLPITTENINLSMRHITLNSDYS